MRETTSYPRGLQISVENLDKMIKTKWANIDSINNVVRELKEELDIDLLDKDIVQEYKMQYMEMHKEEDI